MQNITTTIAAILLTTGAHAEGCTRNHELYRIVPEYRAVMLDGGEVKREMFVKEGDTRLTTWRPGHNITYCPDEDKMINTSINSVVTLFQAGPGYFCKPLYLVSDALDAKLEGVWEWRDKYPGPDLFLSQAKGWLGWYYLVCEDNPTAWFNNFELPLFLATAASLTSVNMAVDDPAHKATYEARAAKYKAWSAALTKAESNKSWAQRMWERFFK
jgi:hypothetical protein